MLDSDVAQVVSETISVEPNGSVLSASSLYILVQLFKASLA